MGFAKYHALGNDYIVIKPTCLAGELTSDQVQRICDRHYGVGADGILLGPHPDPEADFGLRLYNPDGGEFEKSGNGLRIFSRYLWDRGLVGTEPFTISTPGGMVRSQVYERGRSVTIEMGTISFDSREIPVRGPAREVLNETIAFGDQRLRYSAATIGNPHCIVLCDHVSARVAQELGPLIETDARFPNRTNVQFMSVLDRGRIQIEIWERGVGYTLASGSSSCAAAAVAHRLGLCDPQVKVQMPGGEIGISIGGDGTITMDGPVTKICEGVLSEETFG
ncbi:MAG: diaminopimelate epimerase [Anaerolineae bacterium]|nr:diaminopimelate epimerase [Anaerolineae bacterium]